MRWSAIAVLACLLQPAWAEGRTVHLRKLTVRSRAAVEEVGRALAAGESVHRVAQRYSVDSNAWRGGYLGALRLEQLQSDLKEVAEGLSPGTCSPFFQASLDWVMLCLLDKDFRRRAERLEEEASALLKDGRPEEAIRRASEALEAYPDFVHAYFTLGVAFGETGDASNEEESYQRALRVAPEFHMAHYNLGRLQMARGDLASALRSFQETAVLRPDLPEPYVNISALQLQLGRPDLAVAAARQAIELNPLLASAHYNLGVALGATDLKSALESFETAAALDPGRLDARLNAGIALARLGRTRQAVERLRGLVAENPGFRPARQALEQLEPRALAASDTDPDRLVEDATQALRQGRAEDAVTALKAALRLRPDSGEIRERLCWTLVALGKEEQVKGRWGRAAEVWRQVLQLDAKFVPGLAALAEATTIQGDFESAENYLKQALAVRGDDPALIILKSRLAYERRDLEASLTALQGLDLSRLEAGVSLKLIEQMLYLGLDGQAADLRRRLDLSPAQRFELANTLLKFSQFEQAEEILRTLPGPSGRLLLGRVYAAQLRFAEAREIFEGLIAEDPSSWPAHYFLGQVHIDAGEAEQAVRPLEAALRLQPDNVNVLYALGQAEAAAGRPEKAMEWLNRGLAMEPDSFQLNFEAGKLLLDLGRLEESKARLLKVLQQEPDHIRTHYLLGRLFQRSGDGETARRYLTRFQQLQKSLEEGRQRLQEKKDALRGRTVVP